MRGNIRKKLNTLKNQKMYLIKSIVFKIVWC